MTLVTINYCWSFEVASLLLNVCSAAAAMSLDAVKSNARYDETCDILMQLSVSLSSPSIFSSFWKPPLYFITCWPAPLGGLESVCLWKTSIWTASESVAWAKGRLVEIFDYFWLFSSSKLRLFSERSSLKIVSIGGSTWKSPFFYYSGASKLISIILVSRHLGCICSNRVSSEVNGLFFNLMSRMSRMSCS